MSDTPGDRLAEQMWEQPPLVSIFQKSTLGHPTEITWDDPYHQAGLILGTYAGLDLSTNHGKDTPKRFLAMLDELTQCKPSYAVELDEEHITACIKWKVFPADTDEMVVIQNIPFVSVCNHHVLPFSGVAHVAYVPQMHIAGLSKFGRVVQHFARQLQVQERLTADVTDWLQQALDPLGVGVVIRAEHMCMTIRGLQAPGTLTTTSAMRGVFAEHDRTAKAEFLHFIQ